jgi:hypothetical protein
LTQIDCCLNPLYDNFDKFSGKYWADSKQANSSAFGCDVDLGKKLWELTELLLSEKTKKNEENISLDWDAQSVAL